ncbi:MAG TPA: polysaccharide biosynthesis C-terminal domain-containing protein [Gemmatimonadales bacterium]|jgi:O-antigen/teichoic acid export membrane protein|nr:polysaccharide biosynthesis C-terminal domain-containing protein [Gemmatimonadales bacterium]
MSRVLVSIGALQAFLILVNLGRSKALSVLLGPSGLGVVSTIDQLVLTVVHLGTLSLPFTALKFMAKGHSEAPERFSHSFAGFLRALTVLTVLAAVVASVLLALWPAVYGEDLLRYRSVLHLAFISVPALALNVLFVNTLAAAQRPAAAAGLSLSVAAVLCVAAIAGAAIGGVRGIYVATSATGLVTTAVSLVFLRRGLNLATASPSGIVGELRRTPEILPYAIFFYLVMSAYSLTMLAARYFVFSGLGEATAGLLQALFSISLSITAVLGPMSNLYLTPLVNRSMPEAEKVKATNEFAATLVALLLLASVPFVLFPKLALSILFTSAFSPAAPALYLFVLWQCLYQIANVYQQLLIGLDDVRFVSVAALLGFGTSALLMPLLIPRFELAGAALALAIGMLLYGMAAALRLRARFGVGVPRALWLRAGVAIGALMLTGAFFAGGEELTVSGALARLVAGLVIAAILWIQLTPNERNSIRSLLPGKSATTWGPGRP